MEEMQLRLAMNPSEAAFLDDVLAARLREMRFELARTDDRHYKAQVREHLDRLEAISARLSALLGPQSS